MRVRVLSMWKRGFMPVHACGWLSGCQLPPFPLSIPWAPRTPAAGLQEISCFFRTPDPLSSSPSPFPRRDKEYFWTLKFYWFLPQSIAEFRAQSTPGCWSFIIVPKLSCSQCVTRWAQYCILKFHFAYVALVNGIVLSFNCYTPVHHEGAKQLIDSILLNFHSVGQVLITIPTWQMGKLRLQIQQLAKVI